MSEFDKVLTKLDDKAWDIHEASEATKKRMATLDRRYNEEAETEEVKKLTRTAEKVLEVEVNLNSGNLALLKNSLATPQDPNWFKEFLRNIAHKNQKNRAKALGQMQTILWLPKPLSLSMSDKHSEQLIRTEILDHIVKQLLVGANIQPLVQNYEYGTDTDLDAQLDAMSDQVIAMLEWFKESDPLKEVTPKEAAYNALYKSSDQRYFDKDPLDPSKWNKLKGGVISSFAERMAKGITIDYKTLHENALHWETSIDLNTKELLILTGNGMLPYDARTRSLFQFQSLVYLPELGGYAGLMENGCGDPGREGNFVFINTEEIIAKKEEEVKVIENPTTTVPSELITTPIVDTTILPLPETTNTWNKEELLSQDGWIPRLWAEKIREVVESKWQLENGYEGSMNTTIRKLWLDKSKENEEIIKEIYLLAHNIVKQELENSPDADNIKASESNFKTNRREITKDFVEKTIIRFSEDTDIIEEMNKGSITQEEAFKKVFEKETTQKDLTDIIKELNKQYKPNGELKNWAKRERVKVPSKAREWVKNLFKSIGQCKRGTDLG